MVFDILFYQLLSRFARWLYQIILKMFIIYRLHFQINYVRIIKSYYDITIFGGDSLKKITQYLKPYGLLFLIAFLLIIVRVVGELYLPNLMSKIVDYGIVNGDTPYIFKTGGLMLAVALISTIAILGVDFFGAKISAGFARDVRKSVFHKVQTFSGVEYDKFGSASLITRTVNDITQLQQFLTMFMRIIMMSPLMMFGAIFMAFSKNASMALIFIAIMPVLIAIIVAVAKFAIPLSTSLQKKVDRINLVIREKLTGIRVIRAFTKDAYEMERFDKANRDLTNTTIKLQRIAAILMPAMVLVLNAAIITIVWVGGHKIAAGTLLVGDMMAVIQYVMHIMMSLMMLSMVFIMWPRADASAMRIAEILETEPVLEDPKAEPEQPKEKGFVEFRDVTFRYGNDAEPVLSHITFSAYPGETTAIIGSTGSGKSTLIRLIPRLYDVSEGTVLVDGIDVREYNQKELRDKIGFVPQKATLFSGTISSNIRYGKEDASDQEVEQAAQIAQAEEFILEKEDRFEAHIAQGGTNVSGGQKQRLAIARAIVKNPEIYIFDDSFSALDFKTDANLRKALEARTAESTVIIVAQRVSTIMNADRILVLDEGQLVGCGRHQELLETCEVYREIVYSQLSKEEMA